MIKSKTVFIVGAGASSEVKMPIGSELAGQISDMLSPSRGSMEGHTFLKDREISRAILNTYRSRATKMAAAADKISSGVTLAHSIDDFIDSFPNEPEIALVGKLAIARAILVKESESHLFVNRDRFDKGINQDQLKKTWYPMLLRILASGANHTTASEVLQNVTFISFNYDRCLEQFLCYGLAARFGLAKIQARNILGDKRILHPYGSLGNFRLPEESGSLHFGQSENYDLVDIALNLKTYTERTDDISIEVQSIRSALTEADTVVFLGFAFHKQNMDLIRPLNGIRAGRIFATTKGMSNSDRDIVRADLEKFWGQNEDGTQRAVGEVTITDQTCAEFFYDYQRTLAN